jgi:acetyl-CoA acetyltransferase
MSQNRVAIVAGCRTPFMKASGAFKEMTALDLGKACVKELLNRTEVNVKEVDEIVYGTAISKPTVANIARDIALTIGLPKSVPGHTVQMACATGVRAIASAAASIALGNSHIAIAGGAESLSDVPMMLSEPYPIPPHRDGSEWQKDSRRKNVHDDAGQVAGYAAGHDLDLRALHGADNGRALRTDEPRMGSIARRAG